MRPVFYPSPTFNGGSVRASPSLARRILLLLLAVGATLLLGRCDLTEPVDAERLVVEAFVETGRPLPPIRLRRIQSLEAGSTQAPAEGATVTLTLGGEPVAYQEVRPGRYEPVGGERTVPARTNFSLTVTWNGEQATARGTTPPDVVIEEVCINVPEEPVQAILVDSLRRDSLDIPAEEGYLYPIEVTTRWSTDNLAAADTSTWVRAELQPTASFSSTVVNFFLQPADVRREQRYDPTSGPVGDRQWTGVYAFPVAGADAPLPRHRVTAALVRGDTAFANFATSRTDPERREPISNVTGAVGIATGIALDSLGREVDEAGRSCLAANPESARGVRQGLDRPRGIDR